MSIGGKLGIRWVTFTFGQMKRIFTISGITILSGLILTLFSCRNVDVSDLNFNEDISLEWKNLSTPIRSSDPIILELKQWVQTDSPSWKRSYTSYSPGIVVRNSDFSINFIGKTAVLNFKADTSGTKWVQVERKYDSDKLQLVQDIQAKINAMPNKR